MKIRIRQSFSLYKKGQEFDWPKGMCRLMIARGLVEEIKADEAAVVEEAAIEPVVEQAVVKKKRKPK